jgi:hypothetical protein
VQGVRIDYALVTPGLLGSVVSCEILPGLPPKWSDHAPLLLELRGIPDAPRHQPCAASSRRMKRFQAPKTSIAAMFAAQKRSSAAADVTAPDGGGGTEQAAAAKLPRRDGDADVAAAAPGAADAAQAGARPEGSAAVGEVLDADGAAGDGVRGAAGGGETGVGASRGVDGAAHNMEGLSAQEGVNHAAQRAGSGALKQPKRATPRKGKKGGSESDRADTKQRSIRSFFGPS